jgi:hypothetical protein
MKGRSSNLGRSTVEEAMVDRVALSHSFFALKAGDVVRVSMVFVITTVDTGRS